jgi:hypothetical protein
MDKRQILFGLVFFVFVFCTNVYSSENSHSKTEQELYVWLNELPKPWNETDATLGLSLAKFHQQFPNYHERLRALAYWRIGTPYQIFNLGEEQAPDLDPIFRLDVSDCTSHVLTTLSLAESNSWQEARDNLIQIHYKADKYGIKKPDYSKRWHFTADRLLHHKMTPQVSNVYIDKLKLKRTTLLLNEKPDGSEFLDIDWSVMVNVEYIPNDSITNELLQKLPSMIGVAFVKESYFKMGLVMAHEGMLMDGKYLLHAGQIAQQTVIEDFMAYYFPKKGARFDGIMLYELHPLGSNNN